MGTVVGNVSRQVRVRGRWLWVAGIGLALLPRPAMGQSAADSLPPAVEATTVPIAPPDTALALDLTTRRVGLTTYSLLTAARGRLDLPRHAAHPLWRLRYVVLTDWLGATSQGADFFVRQETRALVSAVRGWGPGERGTVEPFGQHYQNPAVRLAISTVGTRVGWTFPLPGAGRLLADSAQPGPVDENNIRVVVLAGARRDARRQYDDLGPAGGAELRAAWHLPGTVPGAPPLRAQLRALGARLGPRQFGRLLADAAWDSGEPTQAGADGLGRPQVRAQAGYRRGRTDDYQSANVQRIMSDTLLTRLALVWPVSTTLVLRSDNAVQWPTRRFIYRVVPGEETGAVRLRDFGYRQREVQLRQEARVQGATTRASLQFTYTERQRGYQVFAGRLDSTAAQLTIAGRQESLKDIRERTTAWLTAGEWSPRPGLPGGPRHTLGANTTARLLRLDTPSDLNDQDRDEVLYQGRTYWTVRWAPAFRTTVALAAEWRQWVFLKASQSAENYTERVVGYEPGFRWAPGSFTWQADFQVRALYQVRALDAEQARNRATRLLSWQQELSWRLPARADWRLLLTYQRRESRFAQLDWEHFAEAPLDTTVANDYLLSTRRALPTRATAPVGLTHALRVGYRFFEQRVHQRAGLSAPGKGPQLIYRRDFTWQHGPDLRYERALPARGWHLEAHAWLQFLSTFTRYHEGAGFFTGPAATPEELNRRAARIDPYFDLTLSWLLL